MKAAEAVLALTRRTHVRSGVSDPLGDSKRRPDFALSIVRRTERELVSLLAPTRRSPD
jgi:hypothetical protein